MQSLLDRGLEYAEDCLHERRQLDERARLQDERVIFALEAVGHARKELALKDEDGGN